ncbi:MAG: PQQ-dependent sugar dehydrogenase [Spirochaetia bacterium]|nr:PQQ-dependent sugar dehydrogenase [Spirochaetia bacterium]
MLVGCLGFAQNGPVVGEVPQEVETRFIEEPEDLKVESWIEGLVAPWALVFLPDGRALVSERPGRIRLIRDGRLVAEPYLELGVAAIGEGGLMGLALHPDFPEEPYLYAMYTYREGGELYNRVQRFYHRGVTAEPDKVLVDRIPGSRYHDGGRLGFGPDGMLYATAGENFKAERAQDREILSGSILRIAPDGSIPPDNPFPGSPIWSIGHRNPQGLAWHPETGDLFSSEHGPSGEYGLRGHDIVNVIEKGKNYGWPREVGVGGLAEYEDPLIMWEPATPPAGMTFWRGKLYLATLGSETLMRIGLTHRNGEEYRITSIQGLFASSRRDSLYGRLRAAVAGPDGALYVLTSNRDGRGRPRDGDDKILRITPR